VLTGRVRYWFFNLALALVAAAIPCLAAEVILRVLSPPADTPGLFRKVPSEMEWSGVPFAQGLFAGAPVSFNQLGLRDRERSHERTPGRIRILALGDSVTFGLGVAEAETFPRVTEDLLNATRRKDLSSVEVLNFGMPGFNTVHELAQLRELGFAFHPDVVVLGFLYNDVEPSTAQSARLARTIGLDAASGASAAPSLGRRVKAGINSGDKYLKDHSLFFAWLSPRLGIVLRPLGAKGFGQVGEVKDQYADSSPHWTWARTALLEMKRLCDERGIEFVVVIIPAMARFTESSYPIKEYHTAVSDFCRAHSITFLDLLPHFWGLDGSRFWTSLSDGHPNAQGHRIMASALAGFLAPLLPEAPSVGLRPHQTEAPR
jgi:lysophospholipase L1-like esterase